MQKPQWKGQQGLCCRRNVEKEMLTCIKAGLYVAKPKVPHIERHYLVYGKVPASTCAHLFHIVHVSRVLAFRIKTFRVTQQYAKPTRRFWWLWKGASNILIHSIMLAPPFPCSSSSSSLTSLAHVQWRLGFFASNWADNETCDVVV